MLYQKTFANKSIRRISQEKKSQEISLPKVSSRKSLPKEVGWEWRGMFYQKVFEEKSLPKNLGRSVLYQKLSEKKSTPKISLHPRIICKTSTRTISEHRYLAKQVKRHLHQNFSQEKCLAKYLWWETLTKKPPRHYLPKSFWRYIYTKNSRKKKLLPTKSAEAKSPPKQFRKKPLPKRFCLVEVSS